jgi:hypothetical protein
MSCYSRASVGLVWIHNSTIKCPGKDEHVYQSYDHSPKSGTKREIEHRVMFHSCNKTWKHIQFVHSCLDFMHVLFVK